MQGQITGVDPGATKINQENRIKLMISNAGRRAAAVTRTGESHSENGEVVFKTPVGNV